MDLFSCRICLCSDKFKLFSLFLIKNEESYAQMVEFSSGVMISENDSLPQNICTECFNHIESACEIKKKCISTDKLLRQQLKDENEIENSIKSEENIDWDLQNCLDINLKEEEDYDIDNEDEYFESADESSYPMPSGSTSRSPERKKRKVRSWKSEKKSLKDEKISYQCRVCEKEFFKKIWYYKHLKEKHGSTKVDPIVAISPSKEAKIGNKKPEEHDYKCFICNDNKVFQLISDKNEHVKRDHIDLKKCAICDKTVRSALALERHTKHHFHEYRFLCQKCGKSFRFQNALDRHMETTHSQDFNHVCDMCGVRTKFRHNLERHMSSVHLGIKKFKCLECPHKIYTTQEALNFHLYRYHDLDAPIKCNNCGEKFPTDIDLQQHRISNRCPGKVVQKRNREYIYPNFKMVEILHNGFRCLQCSSIFETRHKWSMHYHQKHKNSNTCGICGKEMTQYANLVRHIQTIHHNVKAYKCDFCDRTFSQKQSCDSHRNTHTGEKPFGCNFCSFRSGDRSTVNKHKKKMHQQQLANE